MLSPISHDISRPTPTSSISPDLGSGRFDQWKDSERSAPSSPNCGQRIYKKLSFPLRTSSFPLRNSSFPRRKKVQKAPPPAAAFQVEISSQNSGGGGGQRIPAAPTGEEEDDGGGMGGGMNDMMAEFEQMAALAKQARMARRWNAINDAVDSIGSAPQRSSPSERRKVKFADEKKGSKKQLQFTSMAAQISARSSA